MRHGYAGHRDRWPVPELHQAARAAREQDWAAGGNRHDGATGSVCGPVTARGADGARCGRGKCAPVVRVNVSHSKTRNTGVDQMRLSGIGYRLSVVLVFVATPLAAQTSLSIYRDGRVVV